MEKNKVKVRINNTEYTLLSTEQPEYVQRVAILVDKKISELNVNNSHLSTAMLAMLAAINLSDDLLKNEADMNDLKNKVEDYSKNVKILTDRLTEKTALAERLAREVQNLKIELARKGS